MSEDTYNDPRTTRVADKHRKDWRVKVRCVYEEWIELRDCTEEEARTAPFEWAIKAAEKFPYFDPVSTDVIEQKELG